MKAATVAVLRLTDRVEDLVKERRCLTHDEYADNGNHAQSYRITLSTTRRQSLIVAASAARYQRRFWYATGHSETTQRTQSNARHGFKSVSEVRANFFDREDPTLPLD